MHCKIFSVKLQSGTVTYRNVSLLDKFFHIPNNTNPFSQYFQKIQKPENSLIIRFVTPSKTTCLRAGS